MNTLKSFSHIIWSHTTAFHSFLQSKVDPIKTVHRKVCRLSRAAWTMVSENLLLLNFYCFQQCSFSSIPFTIIALVWRWISEEDTSKPQLIKPKPGKTLASFWKHCIRISAIMKLELWSDRHQLYFLMSLRNIPHSADQIKEINAIMNPSVVVNIKAPNEHQQHQTLLTPSFLDNLPTTNMEPELFQGLDFFIPKR